MVDAALSDLRVLDLSEGVAGPYCTKLLADLGADVIKVEPPGGGDRARQEGPFPPGSASPDQSSLFLYLNTNKRGITLDVGSLAGGGLLRRLTAEVDVLVESFRPGYLRGLALDFEALRAVNPRLVMVSVTPFGQTGPYRDYEATELTVFAMGGYMYPVGDPEREPLKGPGYQTQYNAGAEAAVALMAAIYYQRETGEGQHIDVSWLESMLNAHAWTTVMWSHEGQIMRRPGHGLVPCKDGFVFVMPRTDPNFFILVERPELVDDQEFQVPPGPQGLRQRAAMFQELVAAWAKEHTMAQVYHRAQELRIPASPVNRISDLFDSKQLQSRGWFIELDHDATGTVRYPGPPFHLTDTPHASRRRAPLLGEHNEEVYGDVLGSTLEELSALQAGGVI